MVSISTETKIHAVEQCYSGSGSLNQIAERFGVHRSTLQKWLLNYDLFDEEGLRHRAGNHHYLPIVPAFLFSLFCLLDRGHFKQGRVRTCYETHSQEVHSQHLPASQVETP